MKCPSDAAKFLDYGLTDLCSEQYLSASVILEMMCLVDNLCGWGTIERKDFETLLWQMYAKWI